MIEARRQRIEFFLLLLIAAAASSVCYHFLEADWIFFRRAERGFLAQDYTAAITEYEAAVEAGLNRPRVWERLGEAYLASNNLPMARKAFETMLRLDPKNLGAVGRLAGIYDQLGLEEEAIELLKSHRAGLAGDEEGLVRLAELYKRREDFQQAEELFSRVLALNPDSIPAKQGLAEMLAWMGRYDEAEGIYRELLAKRPEDRQTRLRLARLLGWQGRFEEAAGEYRRALGEGE